MYDNIHDIFKYLTDKYEGIISALKDQGKYNFIIRRALDYVNKNFSNNKLSESIVAKNLGVSVSYLSILLNEQIKMGFNDYLNMIRINKAKELLRLTNFKTYKIANCTGFSNTSYFIKVFKKYVGVSPVEFRNSVLPEDNL